MLIHFGFTHFNLNVSLDRLQSELNFGNLLIADKKLIENWKSQLFLVSHSLKDWRLAITARRVVSLLAEVLVCGICPTPGNFYYQWINGSGQFAKVPLDLLLGIPMFFRLYLCARVILMHSKMFTQPARRTIGAVNRVNFHLSFCIKTLLNDSPAKTLSVITVGFWFISSWIVMACER